MPQPALQAHATGAPGKLPDDGPPADKSLHAAAQVSQLHSNHLTCLSQQLFGLKPDWLRTGPGNDIIAGNVTDRNAGGFFMDQSQLAQGIQHALQHLYDFGELERNPLAQYAPVAEARAVGGRALALQQALLHAIESLKPPPETPTSAAQWRPYQVLHLRYVEGLPVKQAESRLQLSDRQIRRENHRALDSLASLLWELWGMSAPEIGAPITEEETIQRFAAQRQPQDLRAICESVADTLQRLSPGAAGRLRPELPTDLPPVMADRVLLRQALLTLCKALLQKAAGEVCLRACLKQGEIALEIDCGSPEAVLETTGWIASRRMFEASGGRLTIDRSLEGPWLECRFPSAQPRPILVIDDDEFTIHLFRRYLAGQGYSVVGLQDSRQAVQAARNLQPDVILLDVLIPSVDGWEVLQTLKADLDTGHIQVIVCSVWNEPDMAVSLGADGFIKKPVLQQDLLSVLARHLPTDTPAGLHPTTPAGNRSIPGE